MQTCQNCGKIIVNGVSAGLCPACLIQIARGASAAFPDAKSGAPEPLTPDQLRGRIPGIEVLKCIGKGGMGAVYQAHQVDLDRLVAIKILPTELAGDPVFVERFRQEARALAKIDHPSIVRIYGSGVAGDLCYIVMELVEGVTLRDAISNRAVDPQAALRIIPQICSALEYAHANGIVHRDIKPENILLGTGGKVKVADFGLAKLTAAETGVTGLTLTGARMGTLRYMAPEQFDGEQVDHRSDIYALGVVIYELLTGRIPMGHFPPPSDTPGVDPRIDAVVMRTLQREPDQRYQTVSEIETDLFRISKGQAPLRQSTTEEALDKLPRVFKQMIGKEWKSSATFLGYPLVHVAFGYDAKTGKKRVARGVIAIGDIAVGGLAIGGVAIGLLSFGGAAMGLTATGGAAIGLLAGFGGLGVGGLASGGAAIGLAAIGGGALGLLAMGGGAVGYVAVGGGSKGTYTYDYRGWSDPAFAETWLASTLLDPVLSIWLTSAMLVAFLVPMILILSAVMLGLLGSQRHATVSNPMPADIKMYLTRTGLGFIGVLVAIFFLLQAPFTVTSQLQSAIRKTEAATQQQVSESQVLSGAQEGNVEK